MQIVIDIPQGLKIDFENENWTALTCMEMKDALMNGTPLPPHGRLIDADEYKEHLYACETNGRPLHIMELDERLATVDDVTTILEANENE